MHSTVQLYHTKQEKLTMQTFYFNAIHFSVHSRKIEEIY